MGEFGAGKARGVFFGGGNVGGKEEGAEQGECLKPHDGGGVARMGIKRCS